MWPILWFLIFTLCTERGFSTSLLKVGKHESYCQQKEDVLFCDYADVKEVQVQLERIHDESLKKVFLYNIGNLSLSDSVCVNVALHNVEDVKLQYDGVSSCDKPVELSVKKCNLNRIPKNVTTLILMESKVSVLKTGSSLSKLNIENSEVGELELSSSFMIGTKASIKESKILALRKLIVGPGTSLEIEKSTLNITEQSGIETDNGSLIMKESSVFDKEAGITLNSGASLTVGNLQGQMTILANLSKDECLKTPVNQNNPFVALFLITFFLLILTWAGIAYIIMRRKDILKKLSSDTKYSKKKAGLSSAEVQKRDEIAGLLDDCYDIENNPGSSAMGQAAGEVNGTKEPACKKTSLSNKTIQQHGTKDKKLENDPLDSPDSHSIQEKTTVEEKKGDTIKEKQVTNICQPESGETPESVRVDNSSQSNELLDKKMKLKTSFEAEKAKHQKEIEDLNIAIGKSKESKPADFSEIELRGQVVTKQYNFLIFLQKREINLLTVLALAKGSTKKANKEKMREIEVACNNFESEPCLNKDIFQKNLKQFSDVLGILSKPGSLESRKLPLRTLDEETKKCIQQLQGHSAFKKKEITKQLEHITQFILQDIKHFGIMIQELYEQELVKKIELMESVCYYVVEELFES